MRWLVLLVVLMLSCSAAQAQCGGEDEPTCEPSPTATATPELGRYVTVVPPGGGVDDAEDGALIYVVNAGDALIGLLCFALLIEELMRFILRLRGRVGHDA